MAINIKTAAINFREIAARVMAAAPPIRRSVHYATFSNNSTGRIELPTGWKPAAHGAYLNGTRQVEGLQYDVEFDGFNYTVVWAVPPSTSSYCQIDMEQQL